VFGAWTLVAVFSMSQWWLHSLAAGQAPDEARRTAWNLWNLADVWLWALFTPFILRLAESLPLEPGTWARRTPLHVAACLVFATLDVLLDAALQPVLGGPNVPLATQFTRQSFLNVSIYWVVLAIGHVGRYRRLSHERQVRAAALERQLVEARLRALEGQLRPHFLFNALHTVASLVRAGVNREAVRVIAQLGDLLRSVLREGGGQEVPLRDELAFAERYLAIERARFGDRLATAIDVSADLLDALVPRFVLQPLVENAVRHGIEPHPGAGRVELRAARDGAILRVEVRDTGAGPGAADGGPGLGLANTRARLDALFGTAAALTLAPAEGGGTVARVSVPFRLAAQEVAVAG
ncbi:MAG TPA: histidine kinase, partial [Anaeromyxobacteraceae bacterium]|nr:histidine kinase [Anaeromyxobacteraceae bacterium]